MVNVKYDTRRENRVLTLYTNDWALIRSLQFRLISWIIKKVLVETQNQWQSQKVFYRQEWKTEQTVLSFTDRNSEQNRQYYAAV